MPDYTSEANELANKKALANDSQTNELFKALIQQRNDRGMQQVKGQQEMGQLAAQGQQNKDLSLYKDQLGQQGTLRNIDLANQNLKTGMGISLGENGNVSFSRPVQDVNTGVRRDNLNQRLVKDVAADYDKRTAGMKPAIQSAQSIINALDSGDIQTLGQIKANLPRLEGEKFKPTDAERKLMLQDTAQGYWDKAKNFVAGDSAAISENQKKAIRNIVNQKIANASQDMEGSKGEVMQRWGHRVKQLGPDEVADLEASLGSSSKHVVDSTPGLKSLLPGQPSIDPNVAKAARLQELRKKAGKI